MFRYINAFAEWMSLAFIALSRCAGLVHLGGRYDAGRHPKKIVLVIIGIWVYGVLMVLPTWAKVRKSSFISL